MIHSFFLDFFPLLKYLPSIFFLTSFLRSCRRYSQNLTIFWSTLSEIRFFKIGYFWPLFHLIHSALCGWHTTTPLFYRLESYEGWQSMIWYGMIKQAMVWQSNTLKVWHSIIKKAMAWHPATPSLWPPNHPWRQHVDVAVFNQDVEVETMIRIATAVDILSILCYHDVIWSWWWTLGQSSAATN